jgi:hypothetical protein
MPPGPRRLLREIIVAVLGPPELVAYDLLGHYKLAYELPRDGAAQARYVDREAGT